MLPMAPLINDSTPDNSCELNWQSCDGKNMNGCEADLLGNAHCSACGMKCKGNRRCVDGACVK